MLSSPYVDQFYTSVDLITLQYVSYQSDTALVMTPAVRSSVTYCLSLHRMSSVEVNDENRVVCPGGKQNSSVNDIFALDQPTGRPSILRQTENLPSKTVPKGTKVHRRLTLFDFMSIEEFM